MLKSLAGAIMLRKGGIYSLPDRRALQLVKQGHAEAVKDFRKETAEILQIEKAVIDVQDSNSTTSGADKPGRSEVAPKSNRKRRRRTNN